MLRPEGWRVPQISQALGLHQSTIIKHIEAYKTAGKLKLPPYSPNLNPIERLWKILNEQVRNNRFLKGAKDFKEAINRFFNDILPSIGNGFDGRTNDNFQLLKT